MKGSIKKRREFKVMKVVLLAGGFGTRINEESQFKPKPMILIINKFFLFNISKMYKT